MGRGRARIAGVADVGEHLALDDELTDGETTAQMIEVRVVGEHTAAPERVHDEAAEPRAADVHREKLRRCRDRTRSPMLWCGHGETT